MGSEVSRRKGGPGGAMEKTSSNYNFDAMRPLRVGDFIKDRPFLWCGANDPLSDILAMMRDHHCYAAMVMENGNFSGLLTEHNIIHAMAWELEGGRNLERLAKAFNTVRAGDVMIRNPVFVTPETDMKAALEALIENRFCYMPVLDKGAPVGMLNIAEVMQHMEEQSRREIEERNMLLSHLMNHENYGCM